MATTLEKPATGSRVRATIQTDRQRHPAAGQDAPRQPVRCRAVRERDRARGGHPRGGRPARRPYRQAHRPLAQGQVHRRRAGRPRQRLVGRLQPADHRGALRRAAPALHRPHERARGLRPGRLRRRRSRATAARVRAYTETAWASIFCDNLFIRPAADDLAGLPAQLHDHRRAQLPRRSGARRHPQRDRDPGPPRRARRSSSAAPSTPAR